jgi:hypothetical protein
MSFLNRYLHSHKQVPENARQDSLNSEQRPSNSQGPHTESPIDPFAQHTQQAVREGSGFRQLQHERAFVRNDSATTRQGASYQHATMTAPDEEITWAEKLEDELMVSDRSETPQHRLKTRTNRLDLLEGSTPSMQQDGRQSGVRSSRLVNDHKELKYRHKLLEKEHIEAIRVLRNDKRDLIRSLNSKDDLISSQNRQIEQYQQAGKDFEKYKERILSQATAKIRSCRQQNSELQNQVSDLKRRLDECKDRISRMRPMQGFADTELRSMYSDLCKSIDYWVEENFGDIDHVVAVLWNASGSAGTNLAQKFLSENVLRILQEEPCLNGTMLVALIGQWLHEKLFSASRIFPGLDDQTEIGLCMVIDGLSKIRPTKGKSHFHHASPFLTRYRLRRDPELES